MSQTENTSKTTTTSNTNDKTFNWKKRWIVYSKESVLDKLTENLDTLIKYFTDCEEHKEDIIFNDRIESYIQSRLQNIHNLISSLTLHDEIPQDQYNCFDSIQSDLEKEFGKPKESIDIQTRIDLLRLYIDSIIDMEIFNEDEEEFNSDEEENLLLEDEILKNEKFVLPDNASIINVNNECKKRKM